MRSSCTIIIIAFSALFLASLPDASAQNSRNPYRGIYNLTELNIGYGLQGNTQANEIGFTGLTTIGGYTFTQSLAAGLGIGFLAYNGSNTIPLYLEGGYYFKEFGLGKMRLFTKADAGLLFRINGEISPVRYFLNPLGGMLIPLAYHKEISVSLGLFTQWDPNYQDYMQNQFNFYINAKIGFKIY